MKIFFNIIKFIYNHPYNSGNKFSGILKFVKWQFSCLINPYPVIYPFTENSKLIFWRGLTGATGNIYCGLTEYDDMAFLLHLLRNDDLFVDIGANIGVYSILASSEISAYTISIEPIPSTFQNLVDNININKSNDKIKALNIGLGGKPGKLKFTKSLDTINHVTFDNDSDAIEVDVSTLDNILSDLPIPLLIKIDVEGFETEVLNGASKTLSNKNLKAIIIELNGSGERYNYSDLAIHEKLLKEGFNAYNYDPNFRELLKKDSYGNLNTIYIRDIDFVYSRVKSSRKIKVGSKLI